MTDPADVEHRLRKLVAEILEVDVETVHASSLFREDLGGSSLEIVEIGIRVGREFSLKLDVSEMSQLHTVTDALALLRDRKVVQWR